MEGRRAAITENKIAQGCTGPSSLIFKAKELYFSYKCIVIQFIFERREKL